jgi:GNAT superfamily N-acetyltransferase
MGPEGDLVALRFARGCRCFALHLEGEVAGYGWLSAGPEWMGELSAEIRPPPGEAYLWNCVTLPGHRRRGFFRALLVGVLQAAAREGTRRLWLGSVDGLGENAVAAAGFVPVLRLRVLDLPGLSWISVRPAEEADPPTVEDALRALGEGRTLRSGPRRPRRRRH